MVRSNPALNNWPLVIRYSWMNNATLVFQAGRPQFKLEERAAFALISVNGPNSTSEKSILNLVK